MLYPVAIGIGGETGAYCAAFPDLPGCFSAGDTLVEALSNAKKEAEIYIKDCAKIESLPPKASNVSEWRKLPEYAGWSWDFVDVDVDPCLVLAVKKNITLPRLLLNKTDSWVKSGMIKLINYFIVIAVILITTFMFFTFFIISAPVMLARSGVDGFISYSQGYSEIFHAFTADVYDRFKIGKFGDRTDKL